MAGSREGSKASIIDTILDKDVAEIVKAVKAKHPDADEKKVRTLISVRKNMSKRGVLPSQRKSK